jgi:glycosyltransferase involved in cell wall biosynthesis
MYLYKRSKSSYYKKIISDLGLPHNITFIRNAPFEEMKSYYKRAKIVAVPSVWPEPCGRVIIEGMFWGAAVISTNQGGTPELITHGQTGMLVPAGSAKKLAIMITKLLVNHNLRKKISSQATVKASSTYTPYQITHLYEKVYMRIAKIA